LKTLNVLKEKCQVSDANDKTLPYTAYLVHYIENGEECYDIAIPMSQVEMFDYYYDKYKKDFKWFKQSEGLVNPKLWKSQQETSDKTNKKRKRR
tara:strand:- start:12487 stop:12768 length:282 start_codon:yes stop_codon:yes gene_type:complete